MKILTVTGYKPNEMGIFKIDDSKIVYVKEAIKRRLIPWIEDGLEWILVSGQAGVELWTAELVLELKEIYDIKIAVIPPFLEQESRWPEPLQMKYQDIVFGADFYQPIYDKAYEGPYQFQAKDKWLLEKSDACLLLYDEDTKGTPYFFLNKAKKHQEKKQDFEIFYITPLDLQETVEQLAMESNQYWD